MSVRELAQRLASGERFGLFDVRTPEERAIAQRWQAELNAVGQLVGDDKPFIRMVLPQQQEPAGLKSG